MGNLLLIVYIHLCLLVLMIAIFIWRLTNQTWISSYSLSQDGPEADWSWTQLSAVVHAFAGQLLWAMYVATRHALPYISVDDYHTRLFIGFVFLLGAIIGAGLVVYHGVLSGKVKWWMRCLGASTLIALVLLSISLFLAYYIQQSQGITHPDPWESIMGYSFAAMILSSSVFYATVVVLSFLDGFKRPVTS